MASTLGHALCGIDCLMLGRVLWPHLSPPLGIGSVVAFAVLANVPDLDLLGGPLIGEHPHYFHGQMTHSVFFVFCLGIFFMLIAGMYRHKDLKGMAFLLGVVPTLSHVIVDWLTGPNPGINPSFGIMIGWPFYVERIHAPVTLFLGPRHASFAELLSMHNVSVMAREVGIFGGAGLLLLAVSNSLRNQVIKFLHSILKKRSH